MTVSEAIYQRRSVRHYLKKEVSAEILRELCALAAAAPSAANKQPWVFYAFNNEASMERLREVVRYGKFYAPAAIVVCGDRECFFPGEAETYWVQDTSAAAENIMLGAWELGLGTCWCGCYPLSENVEKMKAAFDMPDNIVPMGTIYIGYPDPDHIPEPRTQFREDQLIFVE